MLRWNKSLALLAVIALSAVSTVRADTAMANYIPGDVEIAVVLDVERALAEPQVAGLIGGVDPQLTSQGLPSLTTLKSFAVGVDIPANVLSGQAQPGVYGAVLASGSLQGFLDAGMAQGELQMQDIGGRSYFAASDGSMVGTLSNAKDMALASANVDGVNAMLGVEQTGNVLGKEGFDLGGAVANPVVYVYLGGLDPMLVSQVSAFATMGLMGSAQTPEQQQEIQKIQPALAALQSFKSLDWAMGFDDTTATTQLTITTATPEAAAQMQTLVTTVVGMSAADSAASAGMTEEQWNSTYSYSVEGNTFSMRQELPKAQFFSIIMAGVGQAMAQAGGAF